MATTNSGMSTSQLLKSIKRRAMVPDNQATFTDQDLIDLMNEEMLIGLVPTVLQMKDEYFVFNTIVPLVGGKSNYPVPDRAIGNKLREVCYRDTNGNEYEMTQTAIDDRYNYLSNSAEFSTFRQFYMQGSDLVLFPKVSTTVTGSISFYYYLRPNNLVKDEEVAVVTAINRNTGVITFSTLPTAYTVGSQFDFIRASSPHNILNIETPIIAANQSLKTITFFTGTKQVSNVVCLPKASITTQDYFLLSNALDATRYAVWYDVPGTDVPPPIQPELSGRTLIRVDISGATTDADVAAATTAAINTGFSIDFVCVTLGNTVQITNVDNGLSSATSDSVDRPTQFTFTTPILGSKIDNIPSDLSIGDYMPLSGQTCIPNIPTELHVVLAHRAAQRVLEAIGDTQGLANATAKLQEMEQKTGILVDNRAEGSPRKIVGKSLMTGLGRSSRRGGRF